MLFLAFLKEISSLLYLIFEVIFYFLRRTNYFETKEKTEGLIFLIPGLFSPSGIWNPWIRTLSKHFPNQKIIAASVKKLGNCPLEEAGKPLLEKVQTFVNQNPGKSITLIGHSNGGRLAVYIYNSLKLNNNRFNLITLGGVLGGTKLASFFQNKKWAHFLVKKDLIDEFCFKSQTTINQLCCLKQKPCENREKFFFFAANEDRLVFPPTASLPILNKDEEHYLFEGEGHLSLILSAKNKVVEILKTQLAPELKNNLE